MNAKLSYVETIVPLLLNASLDFTEEVNILLVTYAEKAVDFPVLYITSTDHGKILFILESYQWQIVQIVFSGVVSILFNPIL